MKYLNYSAVIKDVVGEFMGPDYLDRWWRVREQIVDHNDKTTQLGLEQVERNG